MAWPINTSVLGPALYYVYKLANLLKAGVRGFVTLMMTNWQGTLYTKWKVHGLSD